jgi:hypothetical protein
MATPSPLAAALKPSTPVDGESEAKYQSALSQLSAALEKRKNLPGDPVDIGYMAGLNDPRVRGMGFFAEFASGLKGARAAQLEQAKEEQDVATLRLQIAQYEREMAQRLKAFGAFQNLVRGTPSQEPAAARTAPAAGTAAPDAGAAAPAARATGTTAPAAGDVVAPATPAAPAAPTAPASGLRTVSIQDALNFAVAFPEQKEQAKLLMDAAKAGLDRFKMSQNGTVFDTFTERYIAQLPPGQTASNYFVPEAKGNVLMTPGQHADYQAARSRGAGKKWVEDFMRAEPEVPVVVRTQGDIQAEATANEARLKEIAKSQAERLNSAINKGDDAGERLSQFNRLKSMASKPDSNKIFGVFENGTFSNAVFKYLESNNGIISAKNIRDIWTDLGLDPAQISDKQVALSIIAQQQFAFSSLAKGQGAISDFERQLFNAMGADIKDRPETIIRKMNMLSARAEFDREISRMARAAQKQNIGYDDMKDSAQYSQAYDRYVNKLMNIVEGTGKPVPAARPGAPAASAASPAAAFVPESSQSLRQLLRPKAQ